MEINGFYEEYGKNLRFLLSWRYGVFAGYFILLYGTSTIAHNSLDTDVNISGFSLIMGGFISFLLWLADCRTRGIYRKLTKKGEELEISFSEELGHNFYKIGAFSTLEDVKLRSSSLFSQSLVINCLFVISSIPFFFIGILLLLSDFKYNETEGFLIQIFTNTQSPIPLLSILIPGIVIFCLLLYREYYYKRKVANANSSNTKILKTFGQHLASLRREKGFTQKELAYTSDISLSQVSRIERGLVDPTLSTLNAMSKTLGISLSELLLIG